MDITRTIKVRFSVPGIHRWPRASGAISYLKDPHYHQFHYTVSVRVTHNDRDVEFHTLIMLCEGLIDQQFHHVEGTTVYDFGDLSCEALAELLMGRLRQQNINCVAVEVWEEELCGALVEAPPMDATRCSCGHPKEAHSAHGCMVKVSQSSEDPWAVEYCICRDVFNDVDYDYTLADRLSYKTPAPIPAKKEEPIDDLPF